MTRLCILTFSPISKSIEKVARPPFLKRLPVRLRYSYQLQSNFGFDVRGLSLVNGSSSETCPKMDKSRQTWGL